MTTLRELSYMIEANTDGLNRAVPQLEKVANSLGRLDKEVKALNRSFTQQMNQSGQAASNAAKSITSSAEKQRIAFERNQSVMLRAKKTMEDMNRTMRESGGGGNLHVLSRNVRAYRNLEKVLSDTSTTADQAALAKARFSTAISKSRMEIDSAVRAQNQQIAQSRAADSALLKQENALERVRIKYLDLQNQLELAGAKTERIEALNASFADFEDRMKGGVLSAREFSEANNQMAATMANVKRNEGFTDISKNMTDLAKSVQVALGPLSGIAARITAITALANRNTVAFAGMIGGIIAFGTSMYRAIGVGASFERQMHRISAILDVTGNRLGMTANEVDVVARRVAQATMTTQSQARDAAAALLTVRGVSRDLFEDALMAAQGLSLIGRGDIQSQIRRVARLLEDPAANLKALTESGVFFNAVESERIRLLQMSGRMDEARAAAMERLTPVIEAARGETQGLTGAWDSFKETFRDFVQDAATTSGAVTTLTSAVRDITDRLQRFNTNVNAAIGLGRAYKMVADVLAASLVFIAENLDKIIGFFVVLAAMKIAAMILGIARAFLQLNKILRGTALLTATATGGLKGLAAAVIAIGGIELWNFFDDTADSAEQLAHKITDLQNSVQDLEGVDGDVLARLRRAMQRATSQISDAVIQGIEPDIDVAVIEDAIAQIEAGNIEEATVALERYFNTAQKAASTQGQLNAEMEYAAEQWVTLKQEHMSLITEQEKLDAQLENLSRNWDNMVKVLMQTGMSAEQAEATLRRLRNEIELNNSSVNQFTNQLRQQIEVQKLEAQIAGAVGAEKRRLQVEQQILNNLWQSGIITSSNFKEALKELREQGLGALADELKEVTTQLDRYTRQAEEAAMLRDLEDRLKLSREEARVAMLSSREQSLAMEVLRHKLTMLNAGIEENSEAWNRQLAIVRELVELDFTKQHRQSLRSFEAQAAAQDRTLQAMFMSERTRQRSVALAEKEFELAQKYGSLLDERAQKELEVFKALQARDEIIKDWEEVVSVIDKAFKELEDAITEFVKTGEMDFRKFANAVLEEIFRITLRAAILDPLRDMLGGVLGGVAGGTMPSAPDMTQYGSPANPAHVIVRGGLEGLTGGGAGGFSPFGQGSQFLGGRDFDSPMTRGEKEVVRSIERLGGDVVGTQESVFDRTERLFSQHADVLSGVFSEETRNGFKLLDGSFNQAFSWDSAPGAFQGNFSTTNPTQLSNTLVSRLQQDLGLSDFQAAGLVGNLSQETAGFSKMQEIAPLVPGSRGGWGLSQWTGPRRRQFEAFAQEMGTPFDDLETQYQFLLHELQGSESSALRHLQGTGNLSEATRSVQDKFLRPGIPHSASRMSHAENVFGQFQQGSMGGFGGEGLTTQLQSTEQAFAKLNEGLPEVTQNLTTGLDRVAMSTEELATNGLPRVTSGFDQLADDSLRQATTSQIQSAIQTEQMGQSSMQTSMQVQQLGQAAASASAQMGAGGMGGGGGGLFGMMGGGLFGLFHGGGIVGSTDVPTVGFDGPRLHGGLHPDEFRAILKKDEAVFTPEQLDALGDAMSNARSDDERPTSSLGKVEVHLHGIKDYDSFRRSQSQVNAGVMSAARQAERRQG